MVVENCCWWWNYRCQLLIGLIGKKFDVSTLNSSLYVFYPILAPIPNLIQIRWKPEVSQFWFVGLIKKKKKNLQPFQTHSISFFASIPNFIKNGMKNTSDSQISNTIFKVQSKNSLLILALSACHGLQNVFWMLVSSGVSSRSQNHSN